MNKHTVIKQQWIHSVGMAVGLVGLLATQIATAWAISSWIVH